MKDSIMRKLFFVSWTFVLTSAFAHAETSRPAGFVHAEGGELQVDGEPYTFSAANSYNMLDSRSAADQQFASLQKLQVNALRIFAFSNCEKPADPKRCLVYNRNPGRVPAQLEFPEEAWQQLDYVLMRARELKIRMIMPLANYWDEYGGINKLGEWAGLPVEVKPFYDREEFYRSEAARAVYEAIVKHMVERVNHRTGIAYKNDPTILMWEPINEARGRSDISGRTVSQWINWAAGIIKKYDPHHLVGTGSEGFLQDYVPSAASVPGFNYNQYPFQASRFHSGRRTNPVTNVVEKETLVPEGSYFLDDCSQPLVDVCSFHAWPYNWFAVDQQDGGTFIEAWVRAHTELMRKAGIQKPLYLGEFGRQIVRGSAEGWTARNSFYTATYAVAQREKLAGLGFWNLSTASPASLDGQLSFDVICSDDQGWDSTCPLIRDFSRAFSERKAF
jgi:mannan endo-1,4-beta-mannosidase